MVLYSSPAPSKLFWLSCRYTICWDGPRLLELQSWFVRPQLSRWLLIGRLQIFSIPLNTLTANILKNLQLKQMKSRDKRTKMMSELLNNIKRFALSLSSMALELTFS